MAPIDASNAGCRPDGPSCSGSTGMFRCCTAAARELARATMAWAPAMQGVPLLASCGWENDRRSTSAPRRSSTCSTGVPVAVARRVAQVVVPAE